MASDIIPQYFCRARIRGGTQQQKQRIAWVRVLTAFGHDQRRQTLRQR
jgi:hypothetical protein